MTAPPIRQIVEPGCLPRHRHAQGYAAVVLAGSYEEAGDRGRRQVRPGDVVLHRPWEAHLNRTPGAGARVLNLALPVGAWPAFAFVRDPDALARTAERDARAASAQLADALRPAADAADDGARDWPERLARALADGDTTPLRDWAAGFGVSPEQLSRGFGRVFGVTPQRFRLEARARAALAELGGPLPLADLAQAHGFADQAHMTRAVRAVTGRPPGAWRASTAFKTPA